MAICTQLCKARTSKQEKKGKANPFLPPHFPLPLALVVWRCRFLLLLLLFFTSTSSRCLATSKTHPPTSHTSNLHLVSVCVRVCVWIKGVRVREKRREEKRGLFFCCCCCCCCCCVVVVLLFKLLLLLLIFRFLVWLAST